MESLKTVGTESSIWPRFATAKEVSMVENISVTGDNVQQCNRYSGAGKQFSSYAARDWFFKADLSALSSDCVSTLRLIVGCWNAVHGCFPSREWIALHRGCAVSTVDRSISKLVEAGFVRRVKSRSGRSTRYKLAFEWKGKEASNNSTRVNASLITEPITKDNKLSLGQAEPKAQRVKKNSFNKEYGRCFVIAQTILGSAGRVVVAALIKQKKSAADINQLVIRSFGRDDPKSWLWSIIKGEKQCLEAKEVFERLNVEKFSQKGLPVIVQQSLRPVFGKKVSAMHVQKYVLTGGIDQESLHKARSYIQDWILPCGVIKARWLFSRTISHLPGKRSATYEEFVDLIAKYPFDVAYDVLRSLSGDEWFPKFKSLEMDLNTGVYDRTRLLACIQEEFYSFKADEERTKNASLGTLIQ